jgi:GNAT superfamily N-acetyltransferase
VSLSDRPIDQGEHVGVARDPTIQRLDAGGYVAAIPALAELLTDAVEGGASVNFLADVTTDEAASWWRDRVAQVADGSITALVARDREGRIVGSTLIIRSRNPNSPHRAEIGKVLVHRRARRRGIARALMAAAETIARADGRWLLILDTHTGSEAEAMYVALGWQRLGEIPNHSLTADGRLNAATYFWKDLR